MPRRVVQRAAITVRPDSAGRGREGSLSAERFSGISQDRCVRFPFDLCPVARQMLDAAVAASFALLAQQRVEA